MHLDKLVFAVIKKRHDDVVRATVFKLPEAQLTCPAFAGSVLPPDNLDLRHIERRCFGLRTGGFYGGIRQGYSWFTLSIDKLYWYDRPKIQHDHRSCHNSLVERIGRGCNERRDDETRQDDPFRTCQELFGLQGHDAIKDQQ